MIVLSEVDASIYAKGTTPAFGPIELSVEEEAQGLARRIRKSEGGEREYNVGVLLAELRVISRNKSNGYSGWEFRESVVKRTLALLGVMV
jgi:hypothetical protein